MNSKSGISPSKVFLPQNDLGHQTVLDFLIHQFPTVSKGEWISRLNDGLVFDADRIALEISSPYQPNSFIYYFKRVQSEEPIPFKEEIIYQDDHLLIADKPHFLPVTPGGHYLEETLLVRLKRSTGIDTLSPIHRIDRETAGLVAFSKLPEDRNAYQALFRDRSVNKVYEAIAPYKVDLVNRFPIRYQSRIEESDIFIQMHEVSGTPNSESTIDLIEVDALWARYQLLLKTGKKHQLRLHMSALGMPIKHDQIYPNLKPHVVIGKDFTKPLQLLAKELSFIDPITSFEHCFLTRQTLQL